MTEYVLKKDTPFYRKGTKFSEDSLHTGVILNDDCLPVANLNKLDNPDEWGSDAEASIKNHPDEWKTIAKYKWGK